VFYRASADVVTASLLPAVDLTTEAGRIHLRGFLGETLRIMEIVTGLFEQAIAGYLNSVGAELRGIEVNGSESGDTPSHVHRRLDLRESHDKSEFEQARTGTAPFAFSRSLHGIGASQDDNRR